jgi:UDP-N-acetylmuramoyl-L-alanyl-D-glutamate--2,6-diaminopimelate ligase
MIGVTGTAGKTTTAALIDSVLTTAGRRVGSLNDLANFDGAALECSSGDTPHADVLADWLARMAANACEFAVVEFSSQALAQHRLSGVSLDMACVTNVRRDHLDYHATVHNYRATKARLFDHLRDGGSAVVNLDDRGCCDYLRALEGPALSVGMINNADVTAVVIERFASEQTFLINAGSESTPVRTRIIGDHHVYNCLVAAAVGLLNDVPLSVIARGLERIESIPGRLERLECGQPFGVFIDVACSPQALSLSLETLREVTDGRLLCVFGADGQQPAELRPLLGQCVEAQADVAIVTDDNPCGEDATQIVSDILRGFDSLQNAVVMHDRTRAICWALSNARQGDCVLIAGKGHDHGQNVGGQCCWFDDREVARHWLYEQGRTPGIGIGWPGMRAA